MIRFIRVYLGFPFRWALRKCSPGYRAWEQERFAAAMKAAYLPALIEMFNNDHVG